jgi:hypothetical protein
MTAGWSVFNVAYLLPPQIPQPFVPVGTHDVKVLRRTLGGVLSLSLTNAMMESSFISLLSIIFVDKNTK